MNIDWSKAPAHATHWCPGNARIEEGWIYKAGQEFYSCYAEKSCEHIPNFPAWRALRLIPRPVDPAHWNGKGLPPVGTVCEQQTWVNRLWREVTVVAHYNKFAVCAWQESESDNQVELSPPGDLRPIRTPEQIAAETRRSEIEEMVFGACGCEPDGGNTNTYIICGLLYDAGYRKVTP